MSALFVAALSTTAAADTEQDLIVTAQRRSERLVDVPISITALSGDALAANGVRSTEDLSSVAPGLNFATNGAFAQPTIRGIGTTVSATGNDANVAMYVDGVYQPNQIGNFADLVDIEQVEVLKGPQGTLFGRNATGGAIRITTRRPSFTPTGALSVSYGSFDEVLLSAFGSAGLSRTLATSIAFSFGDDQGYTRNIGTGNDVSSSNRWSLRGKLLFEPSDDFNALLTLGHNERDANTAFSLGVLNGNSSFLPRAGVIPSVGPRQVSLSFDPFIRINQDSASLALEGDLGFARLTSTTSYQNRVTALATDIDRTNLALSRADLPGEQTTWTQEINLVSSGNGPFRWFLGAFYYNDDAEGAVIINGGSLFNTSFLRTEAIAPFGEVNLTLGRLTLIGGLRYNIETKDFTITRGTAIEQRSRTFNTATPRVGARLELTPHSNVYATWSRGFKSGAFDGILSGTSLVVSPVLPEEVDAFELGYKFGRGATNFSVSAFYYDYTNIQFQAFNPNAGGLTQVFNAASAEIYGAEAELSVAVTREFNLRGALAYTHSRYSSFPTATILCPIGAPTFGNRTIALGATNPCTGQPNSDGASGNQLIRTPEFTASLSANYRHAMANGSAVDASLSGFYSSEFFWDPGNRLPQAAYVLVNGELGYTFAGTPLRIAVWGRNLFDETYSLYVTEAAAGDSVAYARPRSIGVSARVTF